MLALTTPSKILILFVLFCLSTVVSTDNPGNMAMRRAPPLLFPAAAKHTATVIFAHGLGDTGYGWAPVVENWRRRERLDEVKFILPHAPRMPVTAADGMAIPAWYDIFGLTGKAEDIRKEQDEPGILQSREYFNGLIQAEMDSGIASNRIILGGFSQGGAISLFTALTAKFKLGGVVALSCYLPLDVKFDELIKENDNNHKTPILMCHGDADQVVPVNLGKMSYEKLEKDGFDITMKLYPGMPHSADLEELNEIEAFLQARLPREADKKSEL